MTSLDVFKTAQAKKIDGYEDAISQIRNGKKTGHWIWYIFPQIHGLGHSEMSKKYEIKSLKHAELYASDPLLSSRLIECFKEIYELIHKDPWLRNFCSELDTRKINSSAALFALTDSNPELREAARSVRNFLWCRDPLTIAILSEDEKNK